MGYSPIPAHCQTTKEPVDPAKMTELERAVYNDPVQINIRKTTAGMPEDGADLYNNYAAENPSFW